jgi:site-specific DNA-methyltransferase (adenine-specific)
MISTNYNPDVLSCLANLSNDEVFTPPGLANDMLDLLPASIWRNPDVTFLDPVSKSGVFLREIAKRLDRGLETQMPDRQKRINHIFSKQLFGIAITELTSLLSRRSVYCSKIANGKYSICNSFDDEQGNIHFKKMKHTWENNKCTYCGASQEVYDREDVLESYAYNFIHTDKSEIFFDMKFDVIIGNPPYQLNDGGFGKSAVPLYDKFVEQAKRLSPNYLTMIIPARWFGGGRGLDDFRESMLSDKQIRVMVDYEDSTQVFPGVSIAGGVCYFLWEKESKGDCQVISIYNNKRNTSIRSLDEFPKFIRNNDAITIVRKILAANFPTMDEQVSSYRPFGLRTYIKPQKVGDIKLYWQGGIGPYNRKDIVVGVDIIDKWKVISSRSGHEHAGNPSQDGKRRVISKIDLLPPGTICTETYLVIGSYDSEFEAVNLISYMKTKFFRFLLSQLMYSHSITKDTYSLIPILEMTLSWTDELLYSKFGLIKEEIALVESLIRPMGVSQSSEVNE